MLTKEQKKLREKLNLPEDATEEQVLEAMDKINVPNAPDNHGPDNPAVADGDRVDAQNAANNPELTSGTPFDDKKLTEMAASTDATTRMLAEYIRTTNAERAEEKKQLAELVKTNRSNAVAIKLNEYSTGDKIVAPAVLDEARKLMEALPEPLHGLVTTMLDKVKDGRGTVTLGETSVRSRGGAQPPSGDDPVKTADERAKKLMEADKDLRYDEAMGQVFAEDFDLFEQYRTASYITSPGQ
jgi:hypothetical protein